MKTTAPCFLLLAVVGLTVASASSPAVKPEDVGLSSERLQRVSQMIGRRIAAGEIAGAVIVVARKGRSPRGCRSISSSAPASSTRWA